MQVKSRCDLGRKPDKEKLNYNTGISNFEQDGESGERLRTTAEKPEGWSYVLGNFAKALSDPSYPR